MNTDFAYRYEVKSGKRCGWQRSKIDEKGNAVEIAFDHRLSQLRGEVFPIVRASGICIDSCVPAPGVCLLVAKRIIWHTDRTACAGIKIIGGSFRRANPGLHERKIGP